MQALFGGDDGERDDMKCDLCRKAIKDRVDGCECGVICCPECWADHADACNIALEKGPIP